MKAKDKIDHHLKIVCRLITNVDYHLDNLNTLTGLEDEEKKIMEGLFVLRSYRSTLWYLIVLDLTKILNNSDQEKYNLWKLINIVKEHKRKTFWKHAVELDKLSELSNNKYEIESLIAKFVHVRNKDIAHFDDIEINFKITLDDLSRSLTFCKEIYNIINYWLNDSTAQWYCPSMDTITPVIFRLNAYSKIRNLFFENRLKLNKEIKMAELSPILRPGATYID